MQDRRLAVRSSKSGLIRSTCLAPAALRDATLFHFAGHAVFDDQRPGRFAPRFGRIGTRVVLRFLGDPLGLDLNAGPIVSAGGPYTVVLGQSVLLQSTASEWNFDS